jgi:hypothetical protein
MTTEPVEGNQEQPTGGTEQSTPSPSGSNGQPLPDVSAIITRLDEQEKLLRGFQKGTDKQIGQVKSEIKRILELREEGLNESQIERELWIDRQIESQTEQRQPAPDKSEKTSGNDVLSFADAIAEVEKYGLSPNEAAFIDLLRKNPSKEQLKDYVLERKKPTNPPNPADVVQSPSGGAQAQNAQAEYESKMSNIVQTMRGDAKQRAIAELRVWARGKGIQNV